MSIRQRQGKKKLATLVLYLVFNTSDAHSAALAVDKVVNNRIYKENAAVPRIILITICSRPPGTI